MQAHTSYPHCFKASLLITQIDGKAWGWNKKLRNLFHSQKLLKNKQTKNYFFLFWKKKKTLLSNWTKPLWKNNSSPPQSCVSSQNICFQINSGILTFCLKAHGLFSVHVQEQSHVVECFVQSIILVLQIPGVGFVQLCSKRCGSTPSWRSFTTSNVFSDLAKVNQMKY